MLRDKHVNLNKCFTYEIMKSIGHYCDWKYNYIIVLYLTLGRLNNNMEQIIFNSKRVCLLYSTHTLL